MSLTHPLFSSLPHLDDWHSHEIGLSQVASLEVKIEDAEQENSPQPIIEDMLAVCAKVPATNQALSDHFHNAPAGHWQSALSEIRAEMVECRPQILESVFKEMKELVAQDWPQFEADQLRPLQKNISQQNETIEYVITYIHYTRLLRATY